MAATPQQTDAARAQRNLQQFALYGVSTLTIFFVAGFAPTLATWFMVLLLIGVILINGGTYAALMGDALTLLGGAK